MTEDRPVVYVVDDDPSVRKALDRLLRAVGHNVITFPSAVEFLKFTPPDAPGCLILDINMPALNGLELQECLGQAGNPFPIIFITGHGTVPMSVRAMKAGAIDFLQKPFGEKDLLGLVLQAIEKDRRAKRAHKELKELRERVVTLTPREYEVFALVVTGMLNKQIAYELGTTEKTIKVHRARVMTKMGAESVADLVRFSEKLAVHSVPE
jgi:FixJ family two-component response regulator